MKHSILPLLVIFSLIGCSSRSSTSPPKTISSAAQAREAQTLEIRKKMNAITVADGITDVEAELIAKCYFDIYVGCGNLEGIRDGGDSWIVKGRHGRGGKEIVGFYIDKENGKITSTIGPSYASPFEICQ